MAANLDESAVNTLLSVVNWAELTKGSEIDWLKIPNTQTVIIMACHCCVNGPVGIGKPTTFPLLTAQMSIKSALGNQGSNTSWEGFCLLVANKIKTLNLVQKSAHKAKWGDFYPIKKDPSKA